MALCTLKKMTFWLVVGALTSAQSVFAGSHSHRDRSHCPVDRHSQQHSHFDKDQFFERGRLDLVVIASNLNQVFLVEGITGLDPTTDPTVASLVNALNGTPTAGAGSIASVAADFGALLVTLGANPQAAANVVAALNNYALAAEAYSAAVATGGSIVDQTNAANLWQTAGQVLAAALQAATGSSSSTFLNLIDQLIVVQTGIIQNDTALNFPPAVADNFTAFQLSNEIADVVIGQLIRHRDHCQSNRDHCHSR